MVLNEGQILSFHSLCIGNIHVMFKLVCRATWEKIQLIKKCLRSNEDMNLFPVLLAGEQLWIILDGTSDVLGWEIAELTHLKVNVSLDECFSV